MSVTDPVQASQRLSAIALDSGLSTGERALSVGRVQRDLLADYAGASRSFAVARDEAADPAAVSEAELELDAPGVGPAPADGFDQCGLMHRGEGGVVGVAGSDDLDVGSGGHAERPEPGVGSAPLTQPRLRRLGIGPAGRRQAP